MTPRQLKRYGKLWAYRESLMLEYERLADLHRRRRHLWQTLRDTTTKLLEMENAAR